MINDKKHLTAITRKKLSLPMKNLIAQSLITGRSLDYGCGKGFSAEELGMSKFDPHYAPERPEGKFDTITSNYVLNVVNEEDVNGIIEDIKSLLKDDTSRAYLSVRRDVKQEGFTKRGTYREMLF